MKGFEVLEDVRERIQSNDFHVKGSHSRRCNAEEVLLIVNGLIISSSYIFLSIGYHQHSPSNLTFKRQSPSSTQSSVPSLPRRHHLFYSGSVQQSSQP